MNAADYERWHAAVLREVTTVLSALQRVQRQLEPRRVYLGSLVRQGVGL